MNNKKACDQKNIKESLVSILIFLITVILFSTSVLAADPGHSAGVIGANDFESGNERFPDSVIVNYSTFLATSGGKM